MYEKLIVKLPPIVYLNEQSCVEELYFLHKGFKLCSFYTTSIIDLENPLPVFKNKKRNIRKARKIENIHICIDTPLESLYVELKKSLSQRHDPSPTHSLEDLKILKSLFPKKIYTIAAILNSEILAGAIIFESGLISHTQYLFNSNQGMKFGALDLVIDSLIEKIKGSNRYLSFGSSSENHGEHLNMGLLRFKEEFGSIVQIGKTFQIDLS